MFATPKLLEALALRLESMGTTIRKAGITGIFSGGTEFTPQWNRFAHEELLDGAYMTPTYGNTLMGLAASAPSGPHNGYKIAYYAPQPRAVDRGRSTSTITTTVVDYGQTGRVKLTTLTKEFFMPGFLERDEGEREPPLRKVSRGTASAASGRTAASRRRRPSACIETDVRCQLVSVQADQECTVRAGQDAYQGRRLEELVGLLLERIVLCRSLLHLTCTCLHCRHRQMLASYPFCAGASPTRASRSTRSSTSRPASRSRASAAPTAG